MMTGEKVSVIIPAYNSSRTIYSAVDSVMKQGIPVEVIIVDDCSTNDLTGALDGYAEDDRVNIIRNEKNMGVAASRNRGVAAATCRYVAFIDSDDQWQPDKLAKQLKLMEQTGAVLCSTARELVNEDGSRTGKVIGVPEKVTYKMLLRGNVINCSSVVMDRQVALRYPMGNDDIHEDYICWLQILKEYGSSVAINEPLLLYRQMRNSKSGSKLSSAKKTFAVYRKVGYGVIRSCFYFMCYAVNGVVKYLF